MQHFAVRMFWSVSNLVDFDFFRDILGLSDFRTFGYASQSSLGMCLVRQGVCRVDWDPLKSSGDRNTSINAFSDFRAYEDTLTACQNPKVQ